MSRSQAVAHGLNPFGTQLFSRKVINEPGDEKYQHFDIKFNYKCCRHWPAAISFLSSVPGFNRHDSFSAFYQGRVQLCQGGSMVATDSAIPTVKIASAGMV